MISSYPENTDLGLEVMDNFKWRWCCLKCEYKNCELEAYTSLLGKPLCKKHYLIVIEDLHIPRDGRPKKIHYRTFFRFIESLQSQEFSTEDFLRHLRYNGSKTSYPTAISFLKEMEQHGFIKQVRRGVWRILSEEKYVEVYA